MGGGRKLFQFLIFRLFLVLMLTLVAVVCYCTKQCKILWKNKKKDSKNREIMGRSFIKSDVHWFLYLACSLTTWAAELHENVLRDL